MKQLLVRLWPHALAVLLFVGISSWYFSPTFNGFQLAQGDIESWMGMSKEANDYRLANDKEALWTNAMFGGMPAYLISTAHPENWLTKIDKCIKLGLPRPVGALFMAMLGFYILCLCLGINKWISIIGSVAFGLSSIHILFLSAGHLSKVSAIGYMAPALGGLLLAYRKQIYLGAALFALFFGLHLTSNHLQMTYYLVFLFVAVVVVEFVRSAIAREWHAFFRSSMMLAIGTALAIAPNLGSMVPTYEYSQYTIRGKSELTIQPEGATEEKKKEEGLNDDYILEYSFSKGEFLSVLIPDVKGGQSSRLGQDSKLMRTIPQEYREAVGNNNRYWGGQKFTGGAFYFGAIVVFLFVLGLVFVRDPLKWALLAVVLLAIALCQKDSSLNRIFIDSFPMYNKFRDTKMILVLAMIAVPLLAVLFLDWWCRQENFQKVKKWMLIASGGFLLVLVLFAAAPKTFLTFQSDQETEEFGKYLDSLKPGSKDYDFVSGVLDRIELARIALFTEDVQRTLLLVTACAVLLIVSLFKLVKANYILPVLGIMILADLVVVDKRYLDNDKVRGGYRHYVKNDQKVLPYHPSFADQFILESEKGSIGEFDKRASELKDHMVQSDFFDGVKNKALLDSISQYGALGLGTNYRVLTLASTFNDASTSYFHKTIGGYHAAKLRRYQDVVEFHLNREIVTLADSLKKGNTGVFASLPVLNMLNTKYLLYNPDAPPLRNNSACGHAWFVNEVQVAASADEEITAIGMIDPKKTVVVPKEFSELVKAGQADSTAQITLDEYATNYLKYTSSASVALPAVFSEIYYPAGWKCRIDGQETPYFSANYVLRGVMVPAGTHTIEWSFEPETYYRCVMYSTGGSAALCLFVFAAFGITARKKFTRKPAEQSA